MQLNRYPQALASLERALLKVNLEVESHEETLSFLDEEIETSIARDGDLKNEQMRKARRLKLQQQPDYLQMKSRLKDAKLRREQASIQLNQVRNEFSVAKLEARLRAASLEVAA